MVLKRDDYDELRILKVICFREYYLNLTLFSLTKNENSRKDIYDLPLQTQFRQLRECAGILG